MCACVCTCLFVSGGQRLTCCFPESLPFLFFEAESNRTQSFLTQLDRLAIKPLESFCFPLPVHGFQAYTMMPSFLCWIWGLELRTSGLQSDWFTHQALSPAPLCFFDERASSQWDQLTLAVHQGILGLSHWILLCWPLKKMCSKECFPWCSNRFDVKEKISLDKQIPKPQSKWIPFRSYAGHILNIWWSLHLSWDDAACAAHTYLTLRVLSQQAFWEANAQWLRLWPTQSETNATLWEFCLCSGSHMAFSGPQLLFYLTLQTCLEQLEASIVHPVATVLSRRCACDSCTLQTPLK